ncbi:MAG TPA: methyl-accepting chemotaxis protein [Alteromonas sp.]|jgi:methyl-accepting chemotaxis protein|nr:methyl-accepting chemotaxis protein [Alteromonas sp.]HCB17289.1 methyl-accepting chemotaxis protein [Alteromonas sp.]HCV18805.1 methyl-accepting chemotaxis protein [Alteromonas sp.]|tara:strand:+ start:684 stop:2708 length:2025 start_codon:yes stop_codon:yes gene_type:complete
MNLTVKARVVLGFFTISVLLLIISGVSLINLRSLQHDVGEVNTVAVPTVIGSNTLKASFLNMGRLVFEAYVSDELSTVNEKQAQFEEASQNFTNAYSALASTVKNDPKLSAALQNVNGISQEYLATVNDLYASHNSYLSRRNDVEDRLMDVEDNADDASTYLLDFSDLREVQSNASLRRASELGGELETRLLTLITVTSDYMKTQTLVRADTLGNEVKFAVDAIREQLDAMLSAANGQDSSGTLEEVESLVNDAIDAVTGSDGVVQLHVSRLELRNQTERALGKSEEMAANAVSELEQLLNLTNAKVKTLEEQVTSNVSFGTTLVVVIVLASLIIAFFTGYKTVNAITIPLKKVNDLLNIASSGDLTHNLDDSSQDEFGQLAKNCNKLILSLKELIRGINVRAEQLAAASEQTSAVTTQTTKSIQDQKAQIGLVATATTEMHSTSQMVSQNAEDTLLEIRNADQESNKVRDISLENKATIEVLARDVEDAAQVIHKLHQDSASIGSILDVIRGIADQTNLLALNAAIEAARAGEQGRGFAVVADEVRTLASRTQESTQEINAMIEVLQEGAEKAVSVMDQGKQQTARCVEQTELATQALDIISEAVKRAHDVSSQIEQSAREQNLVSQDISEKLETIVGIAEETTVGAQQTSESSEEVARLAEELQSSIRQFKV